MGKVSNNQMHTIQGPIPWIKILKPAYNKSCKEKKLCICEWNYGKYVIFFSLVQAW